MPLLLKGFRVLSPRPGFARASLFLSENTFLKIIKPDQQGP